MAGILAFDTSNYTTSAAYFNATTGRGANVSRLLPVERGKTGLRQSDAVFAHVRALPEIIRELTEKSIYEPPGIFAASNTPRALPDSYMPCFLVGEGTAKGMATANSSDYYAFSHQQGHITAAAYSSGHPALLESPFLAWHLSGGTTELLIVRPDADNIICEEIIGGSDDISAGQLIDRAGVAMGMGFPAGRELASLADEYPQDDYYKIRGENCRFSLSGMENRVNDLLIQGNPNNVTANFVINTIIYAVVRATRQALKKYPGLPVLCSGGVASNTRVRDIMSREYNAYFAAPELSSDNAMGIAILAAIKSEGKMPKWTLE